ncbi:MAG: helix-turn-helix transcriptional regulator [Verrucomicrobiales bacterium]|nr:helix-turn-helix transcriptional regulator [Verrucomicrobiales bacterium]
MDKFIESCGRAILQSCPGRESSNESTRGGGHRAISSRHDKAVTTEEMADQAGMSRAVFHRKFKQATTISPVQFVKSMRLNNAAMKIAGGMNVNEAALEGDYVNSSQFSREFKRLYGQWRRIVAGVGIGG